MSSEKSVPHGNTEHSSHPLSTTPYAESWRTVLGCASLRERIANGSNVARTPTHAKLSTRTETRSRPKLIRFTPSELREVAERARVRGRPVACYIRESSLGVSPRVRRTELNDSLIRALARVADQLTRLAAAADAAALQDSPAFAQTVTEVLDLIRDLD